MFYDNEVKMNDNIAIKVEHLSKIYKIFNKPVDRLKETLNPFHKRYSKDFYALNDVSFEIKKGETVGVIGKNGAGKSTLLKILTGVVIPSSGDVKVNGRIASLLELGAGFNPEMTGIENVYLNGTVMGYSKKEIDDRLEAIIDFADIGDFVNQPVKMYSSGMFARLAFAVNAFVEPDILIVDEALSVGDIFFQNKCFKKFVNLHEKGITILIVSHDIGSIRQMSNKTLWLDKGRKIEYGLTEEVCKFYFQKRIKQENNNTNVHDTLTDNKYEVVANIDSKITFPKMKVNIETIKNTDIEIKSFFIKDKNCNYTSHLVTGNKYTVSIIMAAYKKFRNLIVGFTLESNKGVQILGVNSFINGMGKSIDIDDIGIFEVEFEFVLPKILKGEYIVSPAIAMGTQTKHVILTYLVGVTKIFIDNLGYNLSLLEIDAEIKLNKYAADKVRFI